MAYEKTGVLECSDLDLPSPEALKRGVAVSECIQDIPCNPCVDACPFQAIKMKNLTDIPRIDYDTCTGCGKCVEVCPGLALFVIKIGDSQSQVTFPYEFLPLPRRGDSVHVLDRWGKIRGEGKVARVKKINGGALITVEVEKDLAMEVRNIGII